MTAPAQRLRDAARGMREKAEAATPGPWTHSGSKYVGGRYVHQADGGRQIVHAT